MNPVQPDPQYQAYYRPGQNQGARPPGVYFDVIGYAWKTIIADPATWIAVSLITVLFMLPLGLYAQYLANGGSLLPTNPPNQDLGMLAQSEVFSLLNSVIQFTLMAGIMHMGTKIAYGERVSVGDLFYGMRRIGTLLLANLLFVLALGVGFLLCLVPGIYLCGALAFTAPLIVERGAGPFQALGDSFDALRPYAWAMFGLVFVSGLASGLGVILCGIGLLLTLPIYGIVLGVHYTYFFPRAVAPAAAGYGFMGESPPPQA